MLECDPVEVMEDGWSEWLHPLPGFLMQCCDCGLIHELEVQIGTPNPETPSFNAGESQASGVVLFRMRRHVG